MANAVTAGRWADVGRLIRDRIAELRLTKAEVIRRSGISDKTLTRYLAGEPIVRRDKERGLCDALNWTADSVERVLSGGSPVVMESDEPGGQQRLIALEARVDQLEAELSEIRAALTSEETSTAVDENVVAEVEAAPQMRTDAGLEAEGRALGDKIASARRRKRR